MEEQPRTLPEWGKLQTKQEWEREVDRLTQNQKQVQNPLSNEEIIRGSHICIVTDAVFRPAYVGLIRERGKPANLPGGKIISPETTLEALGRELKEELPNQPWLIKRVIDVHERVVKSNGGGVESTIYVLPTYHDHSLVNHFIPELEFHRLDHLTDIDYVRTHNIAEYTYRHACDVLHHNRLMPFYFNEDLDFVDTEDVGLDGDMFPVKPLLPSEVTDKVVYCGQGTNDSPTHAYKYDQVPFQCFCGNRVNQNKAK